MLCNHMIYNYNICDHPVTSVIVIYDITGSGVDNII